MISFLKKSFLKIVLIFLQVVLILLLLVFYMGRVGWEEGIRIIPELLVFLITFLLVVITWEYTQHTRDMAATMAKQTEHTRDTAIMMSRQTEGDLLLRLNELYAKPETRKAIDFIHEARRELGEEFLKNRYCFGERFYRKYPTNSNGDQLRWHLVNFLYTLVVLVEKKVIASDTISQRFGPLKEVIPILEPIEVVRAYHTVLKDNPKADLGLVKREWPPWKLYTCFADEQSQIPAFWTEFQMWAGTKERQQDCRTLKIVNPFYCFMKAILRRVK